MGSSYLTLVNNVLDRLNEPNLDSSTFASARGIHAAAKLGVKNAVLRINSQKWEWPFNCVAASETMVIGSNLYALPDNCKIPDWESFYVVAGTYGDFTVTTRNLKPIQRQEWFKRHRNLDFDNAVEGRDMPTRVFWDATHNGSGAGSFGVTPCPNAEYIINFNYWKFTTALSAHGDTTDVPTNFDWVIETGALQDMYKFLDNDQRAALGKVDFEDAVNEMVRQLLPQDIGDVRDTRVNFGAGRYYSNHSDIMI